MSQSECPLRGRSRKVIRVSWEGRELNCHFRRRESSGNPAAGRGDDLRSLRGSGRCGKCGVRVTRGSLPVTEEDRRFFSEEELNRGCAWPAVPGRRGHCMWNRRGKAGKGWTWWAKRFSRKAGDTSYGIAVDLGTTTLALLWWEDRARKLRPGSG